MYLLLSGRGLPSPSPEGILLMTIACPCQIKTALDTVKNVMFALLFVAHFYLYHILRECVTFKLSHLSV